MILGDEVERKLSAMWPDPAQREVVRAQLERYGKETYEKEVDRIRLAILKLCDARTEKVAELVTAAKRDYRDVILWAEYPEESRALWSLRADLTAEERRRLDDVRRRDREQYRNWRRE